MIRKWFLPYIIFKIFCPCVINTPLLICLQDHIIQPAVSSGKYALQDRYICIMAIIFNTLCIKLALDLAKQEISLFYCLLLGIHSCPLERCKRLWHKDRSTCYNINLAFSLFLRNRIIFSGNLVRQNGNFLNIIIGLSRQSQHKIKLHTGPASPEGIHGAVQNIFLGQSLINDISHSLGSCLWSKGQTALSHILHLRHNIQRKCINTQRRKCNIDPVFAALVNQPVH